MKYAVLSLPCLPGAEQEYGVRRVPWLRHPVYAWLGLRPALAQHTAAEHAALKRWAAGRKSLVEIGVAEGVSAVALREAMSGDGTLTLIDPYHLSRAPILNFQRRAAHQLVESRLIGNVVWMEEFSQEAVKSWKQELDLLLIDGDHSDAGVQRDWDDWNGFIKPGGLVIFHDARIFQGGWTTPEYGPVKLVDRLFRDGRVDSWKIAEEIDSLVVVQRESQASQ